VEISKWVFAWYISKAHSLTLLYGTLSSLLVERGAMDEAEPILREVLAESESDVDQGICSFYLGLVALGRGNRTEGLRLARKAKTIYPVPWLVERCKTEFQV